MLNEYDIWLYYGESLPEGAALLFGREVFDRQANRLVALFVWQIGEHFYAMNNTLVWNPFQVCEGEALALMIEFEEEYGQEEEQGKE